MRQIISGETPSKIVKKTKIFLDYNSNNFYEKSKKDYLQIENKKIFDTSGNILENNLENFLSIREYQSLESHLKAILTNECYQCEKLYPLLGEIFLNFYFKEKKLNKRNFYLNKKNILKLIKKEKNLTLKKIITLFIENFSLK